MNIKHHKQNELAKRAKRGFRGYPVATIAFYGPSPERASKVAVWDYRARRGGAGDFRDLA